MTNAQKWIAAFLVLFILLFVLARVTKKEDSISENVDYYETENTQNSEGERSGLTLINTIGCTPCHGADLKGTKLGPSLYSVKDYWRRDAIINYLRNPSSYSGDERFENYKAQFPGIVMPPFSNIDVKELGKIADYLISLNK